MRLQYGTFNHLPREVFAEEAMLAADIERLSPGFLRRTAESFGMGEEFTA
jgi:hypothetical protein